MGGHPEASCHETDSNHHSFTFSSLDDCTRSLEVCFSPAAKSTMTPISLIFHPPAYALSQNRGRYVKDGSFVCLPESSSQIFTSPITVYTSAVQTPPMLATCIWRISTLPQTLCHSWKAESWLISLSFVLVQPIYKQYIMDLQIYMDYLYQCYPCLINVLRSML